MASKNRVENADKELEGGSAQQNQNAMGEAQNEQGRTSFPTGSTIQGGPNYGQGSHQLAGGSYRQGDRTSSGSSYNSEALQLNSESSGSQGARNSDTPRSDSEVRGQDERSEAPEEGDKRYANTGLERDTHLDTDKTSSEQRANSGSWSSESGNNTQQ